MLIIPNSPNCVFAFWNGMPYETQVHIIELCVSCPTVKTFAVFRDKVHDKWADPDEGQSFEFGNNVLKSRMLGSHEAHRAWVFRRIADRS